jgi:hypothetical protein
MTITHAAIAAVTMVVLTGAAIALNTPHTVVHHASKAERMKEQWERGR